jgi:hypothetical protein
MCHPWRIGRLTTEVAIVYTVLDAVSTCRVYENEPTVQRDSQWELGVFCLTNADKAYIQMRECGWSLTALLRREK